MQEFWEKQIVFELSNNKYFLNVLFSTFRHFIYYTKTVTWQLHHAYVSCLIVTSLADCPRKLVFFTAVKACGLIFLLEPRLVEAVAST
jgi:hypothetical protein